MSQTTTVSAGRIHREANRTTAHHQMSTTKIASTRASAKISHATRASSVTKATKASDTSRRQPVLYGSDLVIAHPTRKRTIKSRQAIHQQRQNTPVQSISTDMLAPTEIEPPSVNSTSLPHYRSQFTQALANEQTNDSAAESALAAALSITNGESEALLSRPTALPKSEIWWPPTEPIPVLSSPPVEEGIQPQQRSLSSHQKVVHQSKNRGNSAQKNSARTNTSVQSHWGRRISLAGAIAVLLLLGGYLTYCNIPSISTHIAATQAGVSATFPSYQPSGYRLAEPISYQPGSVLMKFAANAAPQSFTLTQSRSDWDSSAVLANYVLPALGRNFATTASRGLTIYSTNNAAAWVNGGVLYTIKGNATLSSDQVQRIAMSL